MSNLQSFYRCSNRPISERSRKTAGTGNWFSSSKLVASTYGIKYIRKITIDIDDKNIIKVDCEGKFQNDIGPDNLVRKIKREHPEAKAAILQNIVDVGGRVSKFHDLLRNHYAPMLKEEEDMIIEDYWAKYYKGDTLCIWDDSIIKSDSTPTELDSIKDLIEFSLPKIAQKEILKRNFQRR